MRSLPIVSLALLAFAGSAFAASPPKQTPCAGRAAALLTSTPEGFNRYRAYVRVLRKLAAGWQRAHPTLAALVLDRPGAAHLGIASIDAPGRIVDLPDRKYEVRADRFWRSRVKSSEAR